MRYSIPEVCLLGIGIVFFGLICLVFVIWIIGKLFREKPAPQISEEDVLHIKPADEHVAVQVAVTAALAEFLRVDYQDVHIVSLTRCEEEL